MKLNKNNQAGFIQHYFLWLKVNLSKHFDFAFHPQKKSKSLKNSAGFTLIELLMVISIISLLASIILVSTVNARKKARAVVRKQNLHQLQTALEMYYEDNSAYPNTNMAWYSSGNVPVGCAGSTCFMKPTDYIPGLAPKYISTLPKDPTGGYNSDPTVPCGTGSTGWERAYLYKSDGVDYKLLSMCDTEGGWNANDTLVDPKRDGNWPMNCTVDQPPTPVTPWGWAVATSGASQDPTCW